MSKRIAVCIASRGNARLLFETLHSVLRQCALPETKAVVGLDEDDPTLADALTLIEALGNERIILSIAAREDSIGAVYNRLAAACDADLYINGADDFKIITPRWDGLLAQAANIFPDGIGMLGFGQMPWQTVLPGCAATTRGLIEKMGYFMQDFTPYWWMDLWLYEIATMIGRNHHVPIDVEWTGSLRTRGLRDFVYWVTFVHEMRAHRRAIAETIISSPDFLVSAEHPAGTSPKSRRGLCLAGGRIRACDRSCQRGASRDGRIRRAGGRPVSPRQGSVGRGFAGTGAQSLARCVVKPAPSA